MGELVLLADETENATLSDLATVLQHEATQVRIGKRRANKALILFLDDEDGAFSIGFRNVNMRCSQGLAVLEVVKIDLLRNMGILKEGD